MATQRFGQLIRTYRDERARWDQQALADFAGVANRGTISKIENGGACDPETARKIITALDRALELQWRELRELAVEYLLPNELQSAKTDRLIIGLLVPGIGRSLFWAPVVGAIEAEATERHYLVILYQHHNDIDRELDGLAFFENFDSLRGVISVPAFGTDGHSRAQFDTLNRTIARLRDRSIPIVFLDRRINTKLRIPYVGLDNRSAAYIAVRRLIAAGHHRIGAVMDLEHASPQQERLMGYQDALTEVGITYDPDLVRHGIEVHPHARPDFYERHGRRGGLENARSLLALHPRPTALFCGTGDLALRAREAALTPDGARPALALPQELSIIGFDNLHEFELTSPKITRVQYDSQDLGRRAFHKIHRLIRHPEDAAARHDELIGGHDIEIAERESIAGPPPACR